MIKHRKKLKRFHQLPDNELVTIVIADCNILIFEILYERYEEQIFNKCLYFIKSEEEATVLTRSIFSEAFGAIRQAQNKRFSSWLFSLTYSKCVKFINEKNVDPNGLGSDNVGNENLILIDVSDNILFRMHPSRLSKAIESIRPEEKAIILLKYQDNLSDLELASYLNLSEENVKASLRRAKARLVQEYNEL